MPQRAVPQASGACCPILPRLALACCVAVVAACSPDASSQTDADGEADGDANRVEASRSDARRTAADRPVAASTPRGRSSAQPMTADTAQERGSETVILEVRLSTHGNDVSFDQESLQVPASRTVRIEFRNDADPDSGIYHNVAIVRPGHEDAIMKILDEAKFDFMEVQEAFADSEHVLATTRTLPPGAADAIELRPEPGLYMYLCLMPGHGNVLGMRGYMLAK